MLDIADICLLPFEIMLRVTGLPEQFRFDLMWTIHSAGYANRSLQSNNISE